MNLNELIKKYEDKAKECEDKYNFWKEKINYSMMADCETKTESYQEILSDLEKLKKSVKDLDITSINAPNIIVATEVKKSIIGE